MSTVLATEPDREAALKELAAKGGARWNGPLLLGTLGLLAALVLSPDHPPTKEQAYVSAMKSDLRNLVSAEESYFGQHGTYTSSRKDLEYMTSSGVMVRVTSATASGWSAAAVHSGTSQTCGIFVGRAAAPIRGAAEGEPRCVAASGH